MIVLYPTYLWALLGLVIPLAIHLWSKKEGRVIKLGSIQLLRESDPKQTSNIRINEWILLFLRVLIITILVLLLAEPHIEKEAENNPVAYLVDPSVAEFEEFSFLVDSLINQSEGNVRVLQRGLPLLEANLSGYGEGAASDYWQLIPEIEKLPADSIVVFSGSYFNGFKGVRPEINKEISWIILNPSQPVEKPLMAIKKKEGLELLTMRSNSERTTFSREKYSLDRDLLELNEQQDSVRLKSAEAEWLPIDTEDELKVQIYYSEGFEEEQRYMAASFAAISRYIDQLVMVTSIQNRDSLDSEDAEFLVWLSEEPHPASGPRTLVYVPDEFASNIIETGNSANLFYLTASPDPENILEKRLAEELVYFLGLHEVPERESRDYDRRVMDPGELLPVVSKTEGKVQKAQLLDISHWLWLTLFLLLVSERIVARLRKQ